MKTTKKAPKKAVKKPSLTQQLKNANATIKESKKMIDVIIEEQTNMLINIREMEGMLESVNSHNNSLCKELNDKNLELCRIEAEYRKLIIFVGGITAQPWYKKLSIKSQVDNFLNGGK